MSSVRAVSDTEYSEGDDNSGRGLSAMEEGLTTSVGDPGSADLGSRSAYFYRDSDPGSARKTVQIYNTALVKKLSHVDSTVNIYLDLNHKQKQNGRYELKKVFAEKFDA